MYPKYYYFIFSLLDAIPQTDIKPVGMQSNDSRIDGVGLMDLCTGVPVDDGNACTVDSCDPATGKVTHVAKVCYDLRS